MSQVSGDDGGVTPWFGTRQTHRSKPTRLAGEVRACGRRGSGGGEQTGSPTSDGVFVGAQEPRQQQQVEEVHQRQDVVAEQAGCKHRDRRVDA